MRRVRWAGALGLSLLTGVTFAVPSASSAPIAPAAPPPSLVPNLVVRRTDTSAFPLVRIDAQPVGQTVAPGAYSVKENGTAVSGLQAQTITQAARPVGTVLVIDTAGSMNDNEKLAEAKAAAKQFVSRKGPNDLVALVAAGPVAQVVENFTADAGQLNAIIDGLGAEGELALYDGLRAAASLFDDRPELLGDIIAIVDRRDTLSKTSPSQAHAEEGGSKAMTFMVGVPGNADFDGAILHGLTANGGQYLQVNAPPQLSEVVDSIQRSFQGGAELSYSSKANGTALDLSVLGGGLGVTVHTVAGSISGGSDLNPSTVTLRVAPGPLKDKFGVLVIALLALVAAGLFAYGLLALTSTDGSLEAALQPYQEGGLKPVNNDDGDVKLAQTAFVERAVEATARIADQQGLLERVEAMLEQADVALRPAEALFFYAISVVIGTVALLALKGPLFGFFGLIIVGLGPPSVLSFMAKRRLKKFNAQLPDTLQLLASSLRAGFSFLQGVEAVASESQNPMGSELRRVIVEAQLGRPVEEALQDCADRMRSPDFDWAVMAVRIQREVGGNLAELLQTVGETMIERERLRRDVKSLTAEGRVSAIVLAILPPALGLLFYVTNPTYMKVLFNETSGQIALGTATVVAILGFVWMNKIVDIEV